MNPCEALALHRDGVPRNREIALTVLRGAGIVVRVACDGQEAFDCWVSSASTAS
ncbi:hypothetical protein [Paraburkholderia sp. 40]|uniref:hypothetical protein n=1 Tax=Paraburkholderia sp. 40 TaxID=2991059 RepID=UPI003D20C82E